MVIRNCIHRLLKEVPMLACAATTMLPGCLSCEAATDTDPGSHPMAMALQPFIDDNISAGAVAFVATRDRIREEEAVGMADVEAQRPMTSDSLFAIASMSKPITVTALMMLVDEGKVRIDDPVEKYLPEFKGQMYATGGNSNEVVLKTPPRSMGVRDLLFHVSGLPKGYPFNSIKSDSLPLAAWTKIYAALPLESPPETQYDYSNPGINTVGRLVEVISGEPYEKFLQERIFTPLGMNDTTFVPNADQLRRLASLYQVTPDHGGLVKAPIGAFTYPLDDPRRYPVPSAGLFSTAGDLVKFCQMFLSGGTLDGQKYLQPGTVAMMARVETPPNVRTRRGFPWAEDLGKDGEAYGHGGAFRTYMVIDPKTNLIGVLMLQHLGGWTAADETSQGKKVYPTFIQKVYDIASVSASVEKSPEP